MTLVGLCLRAAAIAFVVFTFYNPTALCFWDVAYHSVRHTPDTMTWPLPFILLGVAAYIAVAGVLIRATHNGIGVWGVAACVFILAALVWVIDYIFGMAWHVHLVIWAAEIGIALILFIGLVWPALYRRLSGQVTTTQAAAIDAHVHHG